MIKHTVKTVHRYRLFLSAVIVLSFFRLSGLEPLRVADFLRARLGGAVGMSTSVPENPFNRLALQLKEKEEALSARERDLDRKEQELYSRRSMDPLLFWTFLSGILILFLLIAVNFYHDAQRRRRREERAKEEESGKNPLF